MTTANQPEPSLREQTDALKERALYSFHEDHDNGDLAITNLVKELIALFQAHEEAAVREKLIEVRNLGKNWEEPNEGTVYELNKMIEQLTHPQAGEGEGK